MWLQIFFLSGYFCLYLSIFYKYSFNPANGEKIIPPILSANQLFKSIFQY